MKSREIEQVELSMEAMQALLEHAKSRLEESYYAVLEKVVKSTISMTALLENKDMTIEELRRLVFGPKSEKLKYIFGDTEEADESVSDKAESPSSEVDEAQEAGEQPKKKRKGHGRKPASEYKGAEKIHISHECLEAGDPCPEPGCSGKLYVIGPLVLVRVVGQPPLGGKVITVEQLRCGLCLKVFKATVPEDVGTEKYDESAAAMLAILRYGTGVPHNRLEGLQENLGIPLPSSTQWDVVERAAELVMPAYEELIRQAAQGDVLHNDDTPMTILSVIKELKEKQKKEKGKRCDDG
jgi:transposase